MRIKILSSAVDDLHAARLFYEIQAEGVGEYFLDSLFSDIDSLTLFAGMHQKNHGYLYCTSALPISPCRVLYA